MPSHTLCTATALMIIGIGGIIRASHYSYSAVSVGIKFQPQPIVYMVYVAKSAVIIGSHDINCTVLI